MAFFRYPGGKRKLREQILNSLSSSISPIVQQYREPFFGGGSIGIEVLEQHPEIPSIWINDRDPGVYCIWKALYEQTEELCKAIEAFTPSVYAFHAFKNYLLSLKDAPTDPAQILHTGAAKIAIHQISFSGLGTMSGGPLGGEDQKSKYLIDCRWSPKYLVKKIRNIRNLLEGREVIITCQDFETVISNTDKHSLIYLDPPYYVKGDDLYQFSFTDEDHKRLATALKNSNMPWVLSYDDDKEGVIRGMYHWARVTQINVKYSIKTAREKPELLIYPS